MPWTRRVQHGRRRRRQRRRGLQQHQKARGFGADGHAAWPSSYVATLREVAAAETSATADAGRVWARPEVKRKAAQSSCHEGGLRAAAGGGGAQAGWSSRVLRWRSAWAVLPCGRHLCITRRCPLVSSSAAPAAVGHQAMLATSTCPMPRAVDVCLLVM